MEFMRSRWLVLTGSLGLGISVSVFACGGETPVIPPPADASFPDTSLPQDDAAEAGSETGAPDADAGCGSEVPPGPGILHTAYGAVRGSLEGTVYTYKNIPYASPPVGKKRWALPEAPSCWKGERDGTAWGPPCMQGDAEGQGFVSGVEDCLQANVWTPKDAKNRPILFWIHGGGNQVGSAVEEVSGTRIYDGKNLADATKSVVVTVNYRLGLLGFLGHASLRQETSKGTGNYGLHDLAFALAWTKKHAAELGGDPSRIMIFGESAGGLNVCSLLASRNGAGAFSAGVMQSGGCGARTLAEAEEQGRAVATAAKCDAAPGVPDCLRALSGPDLLKAFPTSVLVAGKGTGWGATVDGFFLDQKPLDVIATGQHAKVPVIVGANANETSRSVPLRLAATDAEYRSAVQALFGAVVAPVVLAQYPSSSYPSPWSAFVALTSDAKFICPSRKIARALAAAGSPTYRYFFDHPLDNAPLLRPFGTYHGLDVIFVFGHLTLAGYTPSASETNISRAFMGYWGSLAENKNPGGLSSLPPWPRYEGARDNALGIGSTIAVREALLKANCDFWDSFL